MQTQNVTYGLDSSFVRKTKKKIIFASLFYIVPGCLIVGFNLLDFDYVKALLGMPLIVFGVHKFKEVRYWKENSSKIKLEVSADHILVVDSKEKRSIKTINVKKVTLQPIHGKIKSIVVDGYDASVTKIEGFSSMEDIAQHLKNLVGESKVKTAKMLHR